MKADSAPDEIDGPQDLQMKLTPSGSLLLYVSDEGNSLVQVFDADTGALEQNFPYDFSFPTDLALLEPSLSQGLGDHHDSLL